MWFAVYWWRWICQCLISIMYLVVCSSCRVFLFLCRPPSKKCSKMLNFKLYVAVLIRSNSIRFNSLNTDLLKLSKFNTYYRFQYIIIVVRILCLVYIFKILPIRLMLLKLKGWFNKNKITRHFQNCQWEMKLSRFSVTLIIFIL